MTRQIIGLGTAANSKSGDSLRTAGDKINDNFIELYNLLQITDGSGLSLQDLSNLVDSALTDAIGSGDFTGDLEPRVAVNETDITSILGRLTDIDSLIDSNYDANSDARATLLTYIQDNGIDISALSQDIVDLKVELENDIASATNSLTVLINNNDSDITALTSDITALTSDITTLSSDITSLETQVATDIATAVSNATNNLTVLINANDSDITALASDITSLETQVATDISTAVSNATNSLTTLINANSNEIEIVSQSVTNLSVLDSSDVLSIASAADSALQTSINRNSDEISVVSSSLTTLTNTLKDSDGTVISGSAVSGLSTRMDADSDKLSLLSSDFTLLSGSLNEPTTGLFARTSSLESLTSSLVFDSDGNLIITSSSITDLSSEINGQVATATTGLVTTAQLDSAVNGISVPDLTAKYFVNLNAGTFAGFELLSGESVSSLVMNVNDFKVETPNGDNTPFSVNTIDGIVEMEDVRLKGELDIQGSTAGEGSMDMDNQTIIIKDAGGNPRVRLGKLS